MCIANTVVALSASCIASFSLSGLMGGRFAPSHVQNATLAGGVAVGAIASLEMGVATAAVLGAAGGVISTLGYEKLQPFLYDKIGLHDRCDGTYSLTHSRTHALTYLLTRSLARSLIRYARQLWRA